jgi:hypothetical protein
MQQTPSSRTATVTKRYRDAYLIARATTTIAGTIKTLSLVLGGLIALVGISAPLWAGGAELLVGGVLLGAIITIPFVVLGILVAAQGQVLKATLDEAVHSSPFMTDDQKAAVMSLD